MSRIAAAASSAQPGCGTPSALRGDTIVASAQSGRPQTAKSKPVGVSGGAPVRGQAQATNQRLRARHAAASFAADLHPGALERVSAALEAASAVARKRHESMMRRMKT